MVLANRARAGGRVQQTWWESTAKRYGAKVAWWESTANVVGEYRLLGGRVQQNGCAGHFYRGRVVQNQIYE